MEIRHLHKLFIVIYNKNMTPKEPKVTNRVVSMQTIDPSPCFMKLLTSSLLLAAATATQLDATEYLAVWNLSNGNTAKATIGVDATLFNATGNNNYNGNQAWLTKVDTVITNSSNVVLASWTKSQVNYFQIQKSVNVKNYCLIEKMNIDI